MLGLFLFFNFLALLVLYYRYSPELGPHYGAVYRLAANIKDSILVQSLFIALLFFFLTAVGAAAICIVYSHRIAGPLFKTKQYAAELATDLESGPIRFRKKDIIHDLAGTMNAIADYCRARKERIMADLTEMEKEIRGIGSDQKDALKIKALHQNLQQLDARILEEMKRIK